MAFIAEEDEISDKDSLPIFVLIITTQTGRYTPISFTMYVRIGRLRLSIVSAV